MLDAVDSLARDHAAPLSAVEGVGLCGQMHGAVLLDATGAVLRPAILWNDVRAGVECRELEAAFPALRQVTGNIAMPGFTAPKLLWVRKHEPTLFARVRKVLLPKAYIRHRLTGEMIGNLLRPLIGKSGTIFMVVSKSGQIGFTTDRNKKLTGVEVLQDGMIRLQREAGWAVIDPAEIVAVVWNDDTESSPGQFL